MFFFCSFLTFDCVYFVMFDAVQVEESIECVTMYTEGVVVEVTTKHDKKSREKEIKNERTEEGKRRKSHAKI